MIDKKEIDNILLGYGPSITIGVLASHSALDVCDGAIEEGFRTHAICEKGREKDLYRIMQ